MLDPAFAAHVRRLPGLFKKLLGAEPVPLGELPNDVPAGGVYLISESERHLYVGQASREGKSMRLRIAEHTLWWRSWWRAPLTPYPVRYQNGGAEQSSAAAVCIWNHRSLCRYARARRNTGQHFVLSAAAVA